ncbi:hypothetical protein HEK616_57940 [Streptomyces nigrescens]|uniref:Uncharacterized protein n=1 Tax=Streptomyces nigrescens TaxID=1920 RepID=A0ABM8A113_STRNI|nr:hypothetical protein HEK616_57940 [Streptomyces nigrescens]
MPVVDGAVRRVGKGCDPATGQGPGGRRGGDATRTGEAALRFMTLLRTDENAMPAGGSGGWTSRRAPGCDARGAPYVATGSGGSCRASQAR